MMKHSPVHCKRKTCSESLSAEGLPLEKCQSLPSQDGLPCGHLYVAFLPDYTPAWKSRPVNTPFEGVLQYGALTENAGT